MEKILAWVIDNKEWLFSGVGIVIFGGLMRLIFKKTFSSSSQCIRSGVNSINIQAGRNLNIGSKNKRNDSKAE